MPAKIRTFIGVPVPATPALRDALRQMERIGHPVKPTAADNLHVTLKFLGDTPRQQLDNVTDAIRLASTGSPVHELELVGLGAFPNDVRPSVVWAGMRPADHLQHIAAELDRLLEPLGFPPEARAFHPHLTLAYVKGRAAGLSETISEGRDHAFGKATISEVVLYQSELTPKGSRYTPLACVKLASP